MQIEERKVLSTDVLIIGGGTAGCYAALTIREESDLSVIHAEKANNQKKRLSRSRSQCRSMHTLSRDASRKTM